MGSRSANSAPTGNVGTFIACALIRQLLCKRRPLSENWPLPVDYIDGNNEDEGDAEEYCGGVCEMVRVIWSTDI